MSALAKRLRVKSAGLPPARPAEIELAIEWVLSHIQNRYVERRILEALTEADALAYARSEISACGHVSRGCWFEGHHGDVWAWFGEHTAPALGERFVLIRAAALVRRVRAGATSAPQPSLFQEAIL